MPDRSSVLEGPHDIGKVSDGREDLSEAVDVLDSGHPGDVGIDRYHCFGNERSSECLEHGGKVVMFMPKLGCLCPYLSCLPRVRILIVIR